ncbi:MAG: hypothetical protein ABSG25_12065 [Bryobacteraceae bacterium]
MAGIFANAPRLSANVLAWQNRVSMNGLAIVAANLRGRRIREALQSVAKRLRVISMPNEVGQPQLLSALEAFRD